MQCLIISKQIVDQCVCWLDKCVDSIKKYNYNVYLDNKEFIDKAEAYKFELSLKKHVTSDMFSELNDWFAMYANGIEGYNFDEVDKPSFLEIMQFTTDYCWEYGENKPKNTIYKIV